MTSKESHIQRIRNSEISEHNKRQILRFLEELETDKKISSVESAVNKYAPALRYIGEE